MAKLYFRYGAMNSGKSTALLQAAHNYEERGQGIMLAKPSIDAKGDTYIVSRLGARRRVDILVRPDDDIRDKFLKASSSSAHPIASLLVDEAQFLSRDQVDGLMSIVVRDKVPVLAYGIRTDFQTNDFEGSRRLLDIAHSIEELKTICRCGHKALFNGRRVGGKFVFEGDQVSIDGIDSEYESLCAECYARESEGRIW